MENPKKSTEHQPVIEPKDISQEFMNLEIYDFSDLLRKLRHEPALAITVDWPGISGARRLKAFIESPADGQVRNATIRATRPQYEQEVNVFMSGVKWEKIEE